MGRVPSRDLVFGCLVAVIAVLSTLTGWSIANNVLRQHPLPQVTSPQTLLEQCQQRDWRELVACLFADNINDQQIEVENLRAQQATANWAFWSLMLALASFVFAAIGAYFVWRTLVETTKATKAATESLEHTRASTQLELRAYVIMESVELLDFAPGQCPKALCTLVNSGLTPARRLLALGKLVILDDPNAPVDFVDPRPAVPTREMGAGQKAPYGAKGKELTQQDYDDVMSKKKFCVFALTCDYNDVFGGTHHTVARAYRAAPLPTGDSERMALASSNNEMK